MTMDVDLYRRTVPLPQPDGSVVRFSVIDAGPRDALRTLVFVHGFGGRAAYWHFQLDHFHYDSRVIALDLRGHGLSDAPHSRYDADELCADVSALLAAVGAPERFVLVAHSFGGAVSALFTTRHPQRVERLVIIGSAVQFKLKWAGRALLGLPAPLLRFLQRFSALARLYPPAHVVSAQNRNALSKWDGTDVLMRIATPTLVILGQRDSLFDEASQHQIAQLIPGAEEVVIPVTAHQVMVERPDAVNRAMERFLGPARLAEERAARRARARALEAARPWVKFYDSRTPYRIRPPAAPLHRTLEAAARRFGAVAALTFYGRRISYRMLDRLANRFASGLAGLGVAHGERVAMVLPNIPQAVIAYYGVLKLGAVAVFVNPLFSREELAERLQDSGARVLVALTSLRGEIEAIAGRAGLAHVVLTQFKSFMPLRQRLLYGAVAEHTGETHRRARVSVQQFESEIDPYCQFSPFGVLLARGRRSAPDGGPDVLDLAVIAYTSGTSGGAADDVGSSADGAPARQGGLTASVSGAATVSNGSSGSGGSNPANRSDAAEGGGGSAGGMTGGSTDGTGGEIIDGMAAGAGVMLTHAALAANALQLRHWSPELRPGDERILAVVPFSHSYGLTACLNFAPLIGATLILLPRFDVEETLNAIAREKPSIFPGVPLMFQSLAHFPGVRKYGVASIRICTSSGSPLPVEVQEEFEKLTRGRVVEAYGLTEAGPATHCNPFSGRRRHGSIGLPLPDTEARIVDPHTGAPLGPDQSGELTVRGPQLMQGYWQRPDATAQALRDGWLHTGDICRMDEDGYFYVIDRRKDVIFSSGYPVYPRDIEEVLYEHPGVAEAAVAGLSAWRAEDLHAAVIHAFIVPRPHTKVSAEELLAHAAKRLPACAVPAALHFVASFPRNTLGKVLRRSLAQSVRKSGSAG